MSLNYIIYSKFFNSNEIDQFVYKMYLLFYIFITYIKSKIK